MLCSGYELAKRALAGPEATAKSAKTGEDGSEPGGGARQSQRAAAQAEDMVAAGA